MGIAADLKLFKTQGYFWEFLVAAENLATSKETP